MSTAPLTHTGGRRPGRPATRRAMELSARWSAAPLTLSGLLVIVAYAAFAHGGVSPASSTRIEVAVAAVAVLAGIALAWTGTLRVSASAGALTGAVLFGLFAAWSAVTVLWSVAPNQTWLEFNRELGYVIVLLLAIALGSSQARAVESLCHGFLAVALLVTAYGLGQKLLPGLHIPGVLNLDHTGPLPRLQEPLGYWNALALFIALAVPIALATAVDRSRRLRLRLGATAAVAAMLLTIVLTYSRGGLLALAIGLAVGMALSGARLGWALWLAAGVLAAVPAAVFGLSFGDLTRVGVSLGHREVA